MDRNKEEIEEEPTNQLPLMPSSSTPKKIKRNTSISLTTTDDDTSTDSFDAFESWTLVNGKEKSKFHDNLLDEGENRIEILKNLDNDETTEHQEDEIKAEQETQLQDSSNDVASDDVSDGISIISETESVGRISPNPYFRDNMHNLSMKFALSDQMDDSILNQIREEMESEAVPFLEQQVPDTITNQQLRQRYSTTVGNVSERKALQKASQTAPSTASSKAFGCSMKLFVCAIFYMGVGLALYNIISKISDWYQLTNVVNSSPSAYDLQQKIYDIELHNNIMRNEIDLLKKQIKYLSYFNEPQQQQKTGKYKDYKESKTFKAWSGNGDSLKAVDITKKDLKTPYKCPDGSFVEIANMCVEQRPANEPSIVDQFGEVVQEMKEHSEVLKTFEQVAEELQGFQDSAFEQLQDIFSEQMTTEKAKKQFVQNDYQKQRPEKDEYNSYGSHKHDENEDTTGKNYKTSKENKNMFGKDDNIQTMEFKKYVHPSNSQDGSKERKEWKADRFGNNSKERKYRKDNSKERDTTDFDDSKENSKENLYNERNNKQKRKYDKKKGNDYDDSGEWQEKYMKHREDQRKQNEQKYQSNKNWYMKRAESRENKRSGEKQYR